MVAKDATKNIVFVSNAWRGVEGSRDAFDVETLNWTLGMPPRKRSFKVKIRHGETRIPCHIRLLSSGVWRIQLELSLIHILNPFSLRISKFLIKNFWTTFSGSIPNGCTSLSETNVLRYNSLQAS